MRRFGVIYVATNLHTGEQYVGQTRESLRRRVNNHKASVGVYKTKFALAMQKHGVDAFSFVEVFTAFDESALHLAEKQIIAALNPVHNMTKGGAGLKGYKPSEATIAKQRQTLKARLLLPEVKAKWANAQIGRKHTKEDILKTAKAKWKPVFCKELAVSFLNQKYAAEYLNTSKANVSQLINKGKVKGLYTLVRVI